MTVTVDMTDVLSLAALDFDLDPAPLVEPQAQGDLIVVPWPEITATPLRNAAINGAEKLAGPEVVVRGNGGNEHVLVDPDRVGVAWYAYPAGSQTVGVVVVPEGGRACLDHREHGRVAVGAGVFVVRRQREGSRERSRLVAD